MIEELRKPSLREDVFSYIQDVTKKINELVIAVNDLNINVGRLETITDNRGLND